MKGRVFLAFVGMSLAVFACSPKGLEVSSSKQVYGFGHATRLGALDVQGAELCTSGFSAFKAEVYPFLRTHCIGCHAEGGIGPTHSGEDPVQSYKRIKGTVNFQDPGASVLIRYIRARHWTEYSDKDLPVNEDMALERLAAWWKGGEESCPTVEMKTTTEIELPETLSALPKGAFTTLRWPLALWGQGFENAFFEAEVQRFSEGTPTSFGAYRVRRPRLITPDVSMRVKGLWFLLNGKLNPVENGYARIDRVVNASPLLEANAGFPFPELSAQKLILVESEKGAQRLSLAVEWIESVERKDCKSLEMFRQNVLPSLRSAACIQCHQAGVDNPAAKRFPIEEDEALLCSRALERVDLIQPTFSPLLRTGLFQVDGHPASGMDSTTTQAAWLKWIESER